MPFRNPITTIGGTLVLPSLRSDDFAYTPSPGYAITGWSIANNPSEVKAQTIYGETVYCEGQGSGAGRLIDMADYTRQDGNTLYTIARSTANITTVVAGTVVTGTNITLRLPPYSAGVVRQYLVEAKFDFLALVAPTNVAIGELRLTPVIPAGAAITVGGPPVPAAVFRTTGINDRATVSMHWLLGTDNDVSGPDYNFPQNATQYTYRLELIVRSSVANEYSARSPHTSLMLHQKVRMDYTL